METLLLSEISFESNWLLYLVPIALLYLILARFSSKQRLLPILLRVLLFSLVILSLSGPKLIDYTQIKRLTALVDVSGSISETQLQGFSAELERRLQESADLELSIYPFSAELGKKLESSSSKEEIFRSLQKARNKLDLGKTNLAEAVRSLSRFEDKSSGILILSDGYETEQSLSSILSASSNIPPLYPVIPEEAQTGVQELSISQFDAPLQVNAGDKAEVLVSVKNSFNSDKNFQLELWNENDKIASLPLSLAANREKLTVLETKELAGGLHRIRARVLDEQGNQVSEQHRWISAKERTQILLLHGSKTDGRVLEKLLKLRGYAIDNRVLDGSSHTPEDLSKYSAVVLNNASKAQLDRKFLPILEKAVSGGTGLLMIGGERSFGLGKYKGSLLEKISPLSFVDPRSKKKRLTAGVVLVLDKSRSMIQGDKIGFAKAAALAAIQSMKKEDYVGVIGFDSAPFILIRLARVLDVLPTAAAKLKNLTAVGSTRLLPALGEARKMLERSPASIKHILVLSDGQVQGASRAYTLEIQAARQAGITISGVALGSDADLGFLRNLARFGKGAFYHTLDASRLASIFLKDIKVTVGEETMKESDNIPVALGTASKRSVSARDFPTLRGFVETRPKKNSNLELLVESVQGRQPLLASWEYGKGKVIAYTSDANGRWSRRWLSWKGFMNFYTELLESIKPKDFEKNQEVDFNLRHFLSGDELMLELAVFNEKFAASGASSVSGKIKAPNGAEQKVSFQREVAGRYTARVSKAEPGDYFIDLEIESSKLPPLALTLNPELFGERTGLGYNFSYLSKLAQLSEGEMSPNSNRLNLSLKQEKSETSLSNWLILISFFIIILEAFLRERFLGLRAEN